MLCSWLMEKSPEQRYGWLSSSHNWGVSGVMGKGRLTNLLEIVDGVDVRWWTCLRGSGGWEKKNTVCQGRQGQSPWIKYWQSWLLRTTWSWQALREVVHFWQLRPLSTRHSLYLHPGLWMWMCTSLHSFLFFWKNRYHCHRSIVLRITTTGKL